MNKLRQGLGAFLLYVAVGAVAFAAPALQPLATIYRTVADIPLGSATGRIDYQSIDPAARRLYISKMDAGDILVFNLQTQQLQASLPGFPRVTGVLAVPELHRLYASVTGGGLVRKLGEALGAVGVVHGGGQLAVIDTRSLKVIARLPGGVFPDGIAWDPKDGRIFVSDELGSAITVIEVASNRVIARLMTGGEVGNVQYDPVTGYIYAPLQSRNELIAVDPKALKIVARWPLPGAHHPHGLAIVSGMGDRGGSVGYVAADGNDRLIAVDLGSGKVLADFPVTQDPDVLAFDPGLGRLYVASESGELSAFDVSVPAAPRALATVMAGPDAHSVSVDPASHDLYLPLADLSGKMILRVMEPQLRGQ